METGDRRLLAAPETCILNLEEGFTAAGGDPIVLRRSGGPQARIFWRAILFLAVMQRVIAKGGGLGMNRPRLTYGSLLVVLIGVGWGCVAVPPCSVSDTLPLPASQAAPRPTPPTSVLQQKVNAQEKRISELSMQLKLLKRIDQDQQKQR